MTPVNNSSTFFILFSVQASTTLKTQSICFPFCGNKNLKKERKLFYCITKGVFFLVQHPGYTIITTMVAPVTCIFQFVDFIQLC